jgi:hypothetical protein
MYKLNLTSKTVITVAGSKLCPSLLGRDSLRLPTQHMRDFLCSLLVLK